MPFEANHTIDGTGRQLGHSPTLEREALIDAVGIAVVDGLAAIIRTVLVGTEAIVDNIALFIFCFFSLGISSYGRINSLMTRRTKRGERKRERGVEKREGVRTKKNRKKKVFFFLPERLETSHSYSHLFSSSILRHRFTFAPRSFLFSRGSTHRLETRDRNLCFPAKRETERADAMAGESGKASLGAGGGGTAAAAASAIPNALSPSRQPSQPPQTEPPINPLHISDEQGANTYKHLLRESVRLHPEQAPSF